MVDINILEEPEGKKKKVKAPVEQKSTVLLTVLAIIPYIALIAAGVLYYMDYQDLKDQEVQLNQQIQDVEAQIAQLGIQMDQQKEAQDLQDAVDRKRQQIINLSLDQKYTVYVIEYLCRALYPDVITPGSRIDKGIYLTSLVVGSDQIQVAGVAKTWGDIIEFQQELPQIMPDGRTPLFSLDDYGQTYTLASDQDRTGSRRYNFEMTIGVNSSALTPLVGEFAGDSRALTGATEESGNTEETSPDDTGEES
jgi:Tfp pilus assembly protein PilN